MSETAAATAAPSGSSATPAANGSTAPSGSSASTSQPNGQPAASTASQPVNTTQELKDLAEENLNQMVTIKVNGQTKKMSVREALKQAELGEGAQKKMQEAALIRKQMSKLLENEDEYFKTRGIDPDEFATERLVKKYERLAMTPEQKKNLETSEKLQRYEARETAERNEIVGQIKNLAENLHPDYVKALEKATPEQLKAELQVVTQRYQQQQKVIETEFLDAWKESGFPKDTAFGTWMASLMHASQVQKMNGQREQALSAKEAAAIVKDNFTAATARIIGQMDAEGIHRLLGPETMKKLREYDLSRVTGKGPEKIIEPSPGPKPASLKKNSKTVNEQGWNQIWSKLS